MQHMFARLGQSTSECGPERGQIIADAVPCRVGPWNELKTGPFDRSAKKIRRTMQIQCCNESKQSLWAYDVSPLLSTHIFLSIIANCIMKVEFSYKIFALYSRYSRLNHPIGDPDSNLAALNGAAEYSNTIREFNRNISSQNHETEIERGQRLSRFL